MKTKLLLILLIVLGSGCRSLTDRCLDCFPTETTTIVRTNTRTDTIILPDTWIEYVDTTACPPGLRDTQYVVRTRLVPVPADTVYRDVICTDTIQVNRDAARIHLLMRERERLRSELRAAQRKAFGFRGWLLVAAVFALVLAVVILRRK